jgi:hypothetical protein
MTNVICIKGEFSCYIQITVFENDGTGGESSEDTEWVAGQYEIHLVNFHGANKITFRTIDFRKFLASFRACLKSYSGQAVLENIDGNLNVELLFRDTGKVNVRGMAWMLEHAEARLIFSFESDATFLRPVCDDLETLVKAFPES